VIPAPGKWLDLPAGLDGRPRRVLPAFLVEVGASKCGLMCLPIWVTEINRAEGWVRWRYPNKPFDVERLAPFDSVHSSIDTALAAVARLLPPLADIPANHLEPEPVALSPANA